MEPAYAGTYIHGFLQVCIARLTRDGNGVLEFGPIVDGCLADLHEALAAESTSLACLRMTSHLGTHDGKPLQQHRPTLNGETLKVSESGLVAKVRQRTRPHSEGVQSAIFRCLRVVRVRADHDEREPCLCGFEQPQVEIYVHVVVETGHVLCYCGEDYPTSEAGFHRWLHDEGRI